jgi:hypothetical protein
MKCLYQIWKVIGYVFLCSDIDFASFYDLDIWFCYCSNSVVFIVFQFISYINT